MTSGLTASAGATDPRSLPVRCRWCGGEQGDVVLDLGDQPAADHFPAEIGRAHV